MSCPYRYVQGRANSPPGEGEDGAASARVTSVALRRKQAPAALHTEPRYCVGPEALLSHDRGTTFGVVFDSASGRYVTRTKRIWRALKATASTPSITSGSVLPPASRYLIG